MDIDWYDVAEIRAIQIADLRAEVDRLRASLATVTADRDAARDACETWRKGLLSAMEQKDKAEAALAASVRRDELVRWLVTKSDYWYREAIENETKSGGYATACVQNAALLSNLVRKLSDGSWLRDLTTMDAGTAEVKGETK